MKENKLHADEIKEIFIKANDTLRKQMIKLLLSRIYETIKDTYVADNLQENVNNSIKMLLRCHKMYEAQIEVVQILKNIKKLETVKE